MIKITGGFDMLKKHLEKKVEEFANSLKNDKIRELKKNGLYKPGITKVVVKLTDENDKIIKKFSS